MTQPTNKLAFVTPVSNHCVDGYLHIDDTAHFNQFRINEEWQNNTAVDLCIVYPTGQKIILPRSINPPSARGLRVIRKYEWAKGVDFNVDDISYVGEHGVPKWQVSDEVKNSNDPRDTFKKMLVNAENSLTTREKKYGIVSILVTEQMLTANDFSVYVEELGVVVTTVKYMNDVVHPTSAAAIALNQLDAIDTPIAIQLFANDPTGNQFSPRFINMNGHTVAVPVICNPGMKAGVYQSVPYANGSDEETFKLEWQPFEKADEAFNLYKDRESAKNHFGQVTAAVEERMRIREAEFAEQKRILEWEHKIKIDQYKEAAEKRKEETAQLMEELDRRKAVRNDTYDSNSTSRKAWSETLKWLPGIVTGILTVVGVCFALLL